MTTVLLTCPTTGDTVAIDAGEVHVASWWFADAADHHVSWECDCDENHSEVVTEDRHDALQRLLKAKAT